MKGSRTCYPKIPLWYKDYFELKATIKKSRHRKRSALPTAFSTRKGRIILISPETTLFTALEKTT